MTGRSHAALLSDQRLGAGILWAFGELLGLVALSIVLYRWMRHDEREGARLDRRLDAEAATAPAGGAGGASGAGGTPAGVGAAHH